MLLIIVSFGVIFTFIACSDWVDETAISSEKSRGCTLIVNVQASGWTDDGKDLSDTWSDRFPVSEGDSVYQTSFDGHYSTEEPEDTAGVVFIIKSIGEDTVTIALNEQDRELTFGEFVEIESLVYAYDGQNYTFTIHFEDRE